PPAANPLIGVSFAVPGTSLATAFHSLTIPELNTVFTTKDTGPLAAAFSLFHAQPIASTAFRKCGASFPTRSAMASNAGLMYSRQICRTLSPSQPSTGRILPHAHENAATMPRHTGWKIFFHSHVATAARILNWMTSGAITVIATIVYSHFASVPMNLNAGWIALVHSHIAIRPSSRAATPMPLKIAVRIPAAHVTTVTMNRNT